MTIPILMYHQIDQPPPSGTPLRGLVVAPESFRRQMALLKLLGYQGLSMRDLEPYLLGVKTAKVVGITFDDGYQNNLKNALPVLVKHGFTATCYAVSDMIGGTNHWDGGLVAEKPLMDAKEWERWLASGMDIGSHTKNHADLNTLNDKEAMEEILGSKVALQNQFNCEVRHFCYPYGRLTDAHANMAHKAGFITATTTQRGRYHSGDDLMRLKRAMVAQATHLIYFMLKIATTYEDKRG
jgi:peptidoglycan/xylan/chitin deacetylase (PgdA/CDA1 family)